MAEIDGDWECVTKSPLGEQKSVFTIRSEGGTFTGTQSGPMGSLDVQDGKVEGNKLTWKMDMKVPMPMMLDCSATIEGDTFNGTVGAGAFGSFPMTGTRKA